MSKTTAEARAQLMRAISAFDDLQSTGAISLSIDALIAAVRAEALAPSTEAHGWKICRVVDGDSVERNFDEIVSENDRLRARLAAVAEDIRAACETAWLDGVFYKVKILTAEDHAKNPYARKAKQP